MTLVRTIALALTVLATLSAAAAGPQQALQSAAQQLMQQFGQGKTVEVLKGFDRLRAAGLSYQPSLTMPIQASWGCKDLPTLRVVQGLYWGDEYYHMLFGRWQEYEAVRKLDRDEINPRFKLLAKQATITGLDPMLIRRVIEDPRDAARREALFRGVNEHMDRYIRLAETDPEICAYVVDGYYGVAIEWLFQIFSLAETETIGPELVAVFNAQADCLARVSAVYRAITDPSLVTSMDARTKIRVLDTVHQIIVQKRGQLSRQDATTILATVKPVRNAHAAPCR